MWMAKRLLKKSLLRRQISGIRAIRLLSQSHPRYHRLALLADQLEATLATPDLPSEDANRRISA
jgi:hypothetical protein